MSDPIGDAIRGAQAPRVEMAQMTITLASGRPMALAMPEDATDFEWLCAVRAVLDVRDKLQGDKPKSRLVLPT